MKDNKQYLLSQLLPYDPSVKTGNRFDDGLKEFKYLLLAVEGVIDSLRCNRLKDFDPLVGENACQIRAVQLATIISRCSFDLDRLSCCVSRSLEKMDELLSRLSKVNKKQVSLDFFLKNESFDFEISADEFFLIISYILTKTKVSKSFDVSRPLVKNERTDEKKIKDLSNVGSLFAKKFIDHLREQMAALSVSFVQEIAVHLHQSDAALVSDELVMDHGRLQTIPCYGSMRVILKHAKQAEIPIIMLADQKAKDRNYEVVKQAALCFYPSEKGYQMVDLSGLDLHSPALVIMGSTCRDHDELPVYEQWIQELTGQCPTELLLSYAAAHRQYLNEEKDHLVESLDHPCYQRHKEAASRLGCSLENPSLFFLTHAFCDTMANLQLHYGA
jgi:hypothetical protein